MKPLRGIGDLARVFLHLVAQLMFSIDHVTNARENVGVVHAPQPRDATRSACLRVGLELAATRAGVQDGCQDCADQCSKAG